MWWGLSVYTKCFTLKPWSWPTWLQTSTFGITFTALDVIFGMHTHLIIDFQRTPRSNGLAALSVTLILKMTILDFVASGHVCFTNTAFYLFWITKIKECGLCNLVIVRLVDVYICNWNREKHLLVLISSIYSCS